MSHPNPGPARDVRARAHIVATIEEMKDQAEGAPEPVQAFVSGMLSGLAASVEILDGGTAKTSLEAMEQRLAAAIGQAYLDGKLPSQPPAKPDAGAPQPSSEEQIRGVQAWMAMDVHRALGLDHAEGLQHQGRKSWADWWAELCAGLRTQTVAVGQVRRLSEMTIKVSARVHARQQALDTLAALDGVSSPATTMTAVGTPVTTGLTSGITDSRVQCWHTEAGTPCDSGKCNQPERLAAGDYGDVPSDQEAPPQAARLLACSLCYEEQGEEVHPHPECPIGATKSPLREQLATAVRSVLYQELPGDMGLHVTDAVLAVILPNTRIVAGLARDACADMNRVTALYERWVKAGPPPLGTSLSRWWDARLAELHAAILGPDPRNPS